MRLIALGGLAGSGKDTAASLLVENHGFERIAFADKLKEALYELNPTVLTGRSSGVNLPCYEPLQDVVDAFGWDEAKTLFPEVRRLLQRIGTEMGRNLFGENFWVDLVKAQLKGHGSYVITDCRFMNESRFVTRNNGLVALVRRSGVVPINDHPSEWLDIDPDYIVVNDGTVEELKQTIVDLVDQYETLVPIAVRSKRARGVI